MQTKKFSPFEAIVFGFKSVVDNIRLFFLLGITIALIALLISYAAAIVNMQAVKDIMGVVQTTKECTTTACLMLIQSMLLPIFKHNALPFSLTLLVLYLIFAGFYAGYQKVMLEFYDSGSSSVAHLFSGFRYLHLIAVALLIFILIVLIGLALLVVPGVYLGLRLVFFSYFIVDNKAGIIESFKKSWHATQHQTWHVFALALVQAGLVSVHGGFMIIIWPLMSLAYVFAYRKLAH